MSLLSPRREDMYADLDQDFIDGVFYHSDRLEVRVSKWRVTLDTDVISSGKVSFDITRMRARYKRLDNFKFMICRKNSFSKMLDSFAKKNMTLGFPEFEHDFIIKSNDYNKVKNLLGNPKIMEIMESQPFMSFEIIDDEGQLGKDIAQSMSEISLKAAGVINDSRRLAKLFELFSEVLKQLCLLKSAY